MLRRLHILTSFSLGLLATQGCLRLGFHEDANSLRGDDDVGRRSDDDGGSDTLGGDDDGDGHSSGEDTSTDEEGVTDGDPIDPDTAPPVRSAKLPDGAAAVTTSAVVLGLATDEEATCRYATNAGVAYGAMTEAFVAQTPTSHRAVINGLDDAATYRFYVRCQDAAGNANTDDFVILFATDFVFQVYRSVGANNTTALASGTDLMIGQGVAVFPSDLPLRVGVGDIVQYDATQDGVPDALAMIIGRVDARTYLVHGTMDGSETAADHASFSVWRAYTSLTNALEGVENEGIHAALRDFEVFSGAANTSALDRVWNIACYGDAVDESNASVFGWTTDAAHPIRIFAPFAPSQVGTSQRHDGRWRDTAYTLRNAEVDNYDIALSGETSFVTVEGLQVDVVAYASADYNLGFSLSGSGVVRLDSNIIRGHGNGAGIEYIGAEVGGTGEAHVVNNVVYGFRGTGTVRALWQLGGPFRVVNNTITDSTVGVYGTVHARNNLFVGCDEAVGGSFASDSGYNATSTPSMGPGLNDGDRVGVTFSFVNGGQRDYRLSELDSGARDLGSDVVEGLLDYDIQGEPRVGAWDVGADEYYP